MSFDPGNPAVIRQITGWLEAAGLASIEITRGDRRLAIRVGVSPVPAVDVPAVDVPAPMAGHLLAAHPLLAPAERLAAGEVGAFLRLGPVLVAMPAPQAGTVRRRTADGLIGFGDTAYRLEP